jgi:hypothetical protein
VRCKGNCGLHGRNLPYRGGKLEILPGNAYASANKNSDGVSLSVVGVASEESPESLVRVRDSQVSCVCSLLTSKSTRRLQKHHHGGYPACTDDVTLSGVGFVSEKCPALLLRVTDPRAPRKYSPQAEKSAPRFHKDQRGGIDVDEKAPAILGVPEFQWFVEV